MLKKWLLTYKDKIAYAHTLGEILENKEKFISIEDIFSEKYYLEKVNEVYGKDLSCKNIKIKLNGKDNILARLKRFFKENGLEFNHGAVAKKIRRDLKSINTIEKLEKCDKDIAENFGKIVEKINNSLRGSN